MIEMFLKDTSSNLSNFLIPFEVEDEEKPCWINQSNTELISLLFTCFNSIVIRIKWKYRIDVPILNYV